MPDMPKGLTLPLRSFFLILTITVVSAFPPRTPRSATSATQRASSISASLLSDIADLQLESLSGESVKLGDVVSVQDKKIILSCLSHFGDFNAWELTQQYQAADIPDAKIVLIGIGSVESAQKFADDLDLLSTSDGITLLVDESGVVSETLGCYKGWLAVDKVHAQKWPATDVNPYIKLLGMIFGLGSPGTIPRVLYGYVGNSDGGAASRTWVVDSLLQGSRKGRWPRLTEGAFEGIPPDSGLRPFELATLRAQTGIHIVLNWTKLGPRNGDLFTRMGGTFVFDSEGKCVYEYFDKGILTYVDVEEVCRVAAGSSPPVAAVP